MFSDESEERFQTVGLLRDSNQGLANEVRRAARVPTYSETLVKTVTVFRRTKTYSRYKCTLRRSDKEYLFIVFVC
jgi:hypothetical protein